MRLSQYNCHPYEPTFFFCEYLENFIGLPTDDTIYLSLSTTLEGSAYNATFNATLSLTHKCFTFPRQRYHHDHFSLMSVFLLQSRKAVGFV
jgi:hypothetical protein